MAQETSLARWGALPLRLAAGSVFMMHGGQKLFVLGLGGTAGVMTRLGIPAPMTAAVAVIAVEFVGGLALLLGLLTRWVALALTVDMLLAILVVHLKGGFFLPYGFEFALTLLGVTVTLALLGSGEGSADSALAQRKA